MLGVFEGSAIPLCVRAHSSQPHSRFFFRLLGVTGADLIYTFATGSSGGQLKLVETLHSIRRYNLELVPGHELHPRGHVPTAPSSTLTHFFTIGVVNAMGNSFNNILFPLSPSYQVLLLTVVDINKAVEIRREHEISVSCSMQVEGESVQIHGVTQL
jgi:hypothetical protein